MTSSDARAVVVGGRDGADANKKTKTVFGVSSEFIEVRARWVV